MITIFRLYKNSRGYEYNYYQPENTLQYFCNPSNITFFKNCSDIRHLVPFHFSFGMPNCIEFIVSSEPRKGYQSWVLKMEKDGIFSFDVSVGVFWKKTERLPLFTKYLLPLAHCITVNGKPTSIWEGYIRVKIIKE